MIRDEQTANLKRRYVTSLTVQLVIGAIFVISLYFMSSNTPVKIEHKVVPNAVHLPERKPEARDLLLWKEELDLTKEQESKLNDLNTEYENSVNPIDNQIASSLEKFGSTINKPEKRPSMEDIVKASRPATDLGRKKRMLMDSFSNEALAILTTSQKSRALKLFNQRSSGKNSGGDRLR